MNRLPSIPIITGVLVVAEIAVLCAPLALRAPAGMLLVLVLPGLAATRVLRRRLLLERVALLVLVPGLSVATSILVGLLVYAAHLRLTTPIWALALAAVVLGLLAAGGTAGPRTDDQRRTPVSGAIRENAVPVAIILCSLFTIAGAVVLAAHGQRSATGRGFTELWALRAHTGSGPAIALGVTNHERGGAHYRLQIVAGRAVKVLSFELAPRETLRRRLPIGNARDAVTLTLSKLPHQLDYRRVRLAPLAANGSQ
jgi:uncharacterized membrane protein